MGSRSKNKSKNFHHANSDLTRVPTSHLQAIQAKKVDSSHIKHTKTPKQYFYRTNCLKHSFFLLHLRTGVNCQEQQYSLSSFLLFLNNWQMQCAALRFLVFLLCLVLLKLIACVCIRSFVSGVQLRFCNGHAQTVHAQCIWVPLLYFCCPLYMVVMFSSSAYVACTLLLPSTAFLLYCYKLHQPYAKDYCIFPSFLLTDTDQSGTFEIVPCKEQQWKLDTGLEHLTDSDKT